MAAQKSSGHRYSYVTASMRSSAYWSARVRHSTSFCGASGHTISMNLSPIWIEMLIYERIKFLPKDRSRRLTALSVTGSVKLATIFSMTNLHARQSPGMRGSKADYVLLMSISYFMTKILQQSPYQFRVLEQMPVSWRWKEKVTRASFCQDRYGGLAERLLISYLSFHSNRVIADR